MSCTKNNPNVEDEDLEENQEHSDDDKLDKVYENEIKQCIIISQKVQNHYIIVYWCFK